MNAPTADTPDREFRDLDLPSLAALLAVIDTGSFTRAAQALGVSQPSVSLAIRRLEERVGTSLVVRTRKRVTASRPGETLAAGARLAFEALGSAVSRMADEQSEPTGPVVLGCHESLAAYALPAFMARFLRAYPRVELRLWNGTSMQVHGELVDGRVDLGLIVNPSKHPDTVVTPLFEDSVELFHCFSLGRAADPHAALSSIPLIYVPQLAQTQNILRQLEKRRAPLSRPLPCTSLELVKSLVLDRVGIGILPRRVAQHRTARKLRSLSPPMPLFRDQIALVRRYDVPRTAAIRAVIEELLTHGKAIRSGGRVR
jgi:DNA-binding transcriptional LysR family regulator